MGGWLIFIIDHQLESVDAFNAILPIITGSHIFTELSTFMPRKEIQEQLGFFFLCTCVKGNNWFSYITLGKTYYRKSGYFCCRLIFSNFAGQLDSQKYFS